MTIPLPIRLPSGQCEGKELMGGSLLSLPFVKARQNDCDPYFAMVTEACQLCGAGEIG
jgi:hypothetical protein